MTGTWRRRYLEACYAYAGCLLAWLLGRPILADASSLVFAVNSLLLFAFLPLPVVLISALALRRYRLALLAAAPALGWVWIYGALFWPRSSEADGRPTLHVLSFNALGYNHDAASTVEIVRQSRADLVALQELNPETALALERELGRLYPYRWLEPRAGVTGGGLLSKFPFERSAEQLPGVWVGQPMVVDVDMTGERLTLVRFHAFSGPTSYRQREEQARILAERAKRLQRRFVLVGDLNASDTNHAHSIIAAEARDSWREAGLGFGHTFPGEPTASTGGSRPALCGVGVPLWLVRIDYVFHSPDLAAVRVDVAGDGRHSDHRGVLATLAL